MEKFNSINEIIDFAIKGEQESIEFYSVLYKKTDNANMKEAYKEFIQEEKFHKEKLMELKSKGALANFDSQKVSDLKISDYLPEMEVRENMNYQESLILAMQKEKAAYKLYSDLAEIAENTEIEKLFRLLAAEEAKHKLKFEIEYDDNVYQEN